MFQPAAHKIHTMEEGLDIYDIHYRHFEAFSGVQAFSFWQKAGDKS